MGAWEKCAKRYLLPPGFLLFADLLGDTNHTPRLNKQKKQQRNVSRHFVRITYLHKQLFVYGCGCHIHGEGWQVEICFRLPARSCQHVVPHCDLEAIALPGTNSVACHHLVKHMMMSYRAACCDRYSLAVDLHATTPQGWRDARLPGWFRRVPRRIKLRHQLRDFAACLGTLTLLLLHQFLALLEHVAVPTESELSTYVRGYSAVICCPPDRRAKQGQIHIRRPVGCNPVLLVQKIQEFKLWESMFLQLVFMEQLTAYMQQDIKIDLHLLHADALQPSRDVERRYSLGSFASPFRLDGVIDGCDQSRRRVAILRRCRW